MKNRFYLTLPLGELQAPKTKVAVSLPELVQATNAFSVKHRPGCEPRLLSSNPKDLFLHYNVKCHESYSDPAGHDVRVKFDVSKVEETKKASDLDVMVSCSCPAFLYWGAQWNLHTRDGLLGEPRPLLQAPTERLDLRANFVICKHVKAVFERILPAIQHNITKILREREVEKNKQKLDEIPQRLHDKQREMRERKQLERLRKTKNREIQEKLLEALRQRELEEEEKQKKHEDKLEGKDNPVVERQGPATLPQEPEEQQEAEPTPTTKPESKPEGNKFEEIPTFGDDFNEMLDKEEQRLHEQQHEQMKHEPHLHKGLPYETEEVKQEHDHEVPTDRELMDSLKKKQQQPNDMKNFVDKKLKRKRTSLGFEELASVVGVSDASGD